MYDKIMLGIGIIFLFGSIIFAYKTFTLGGDEKDYNIICLGGHEYWRANFMAKGFLGIKLSYEGKPISCK